MRPLAGLATAALLVLSLAACGDKSPGAASARPDDMSLGNPAAKVTVIEYASVGCPVCARWQAEVYPDFKSRYIDTGKVHYVFREMLVGGSAEVAVASAGFLVARCAGKDRYFAVNDAVFAAQPGVFDNPRPIILDIAKSAGMTEEKVNACLTDEAGLKALNARVEANVKRGINATPSFVVNGKPLQPGYTPLAALDVAVAEAEAAAK
jgi:protein-disulfide isomerase